MKTTFQTLLTFLTDLKENNNRDWFNQNKGRYIEAKESFESITQELIEQLALEDDTIKGLKAKDCIFRIYRDARFSKDKSPYKTHMGAYINQGGRKGETCGYYFHLEPGASFLAGGLHAPSPAILFEVRDSIYADAEEFKAIINTPAFVETFGAIQGDKLKNGPKGFPKDFEDIELLKHKTMVAIHQLNDDELIADGFMDRSMRVFRRLKPFSDYFNRAIKEMER